LRFNQALEEGAISLAAFTLAEKISLNQGIKDASVFYIDWPSLRPNAGGTVEATVEQLSAVATTGQWVFPAVHRGRGNYSLLLVGNSHADQVERELRREWADHYSTMSSFTIGGMDLSQNDVSCAKLKTFTLKAIFSVCLPLDFSMTSYGVNFRAGGSRCAIYPEAVRKLVEIMHPDILFINFL